MGKQKKLGTMDSSTEARETRRELASKAKVKGHVPGQIKALFRKQFTWSFLGRIAIEFFIPVAFFLLLSVRSIIKGGGSSGNTGGDGDLTRFSRTAATTGRPFPVMDIRWVAANDTDIANFCSYTAGAGHSMTDIFSIFSEHTASPNTSPAYQLLYAPNDANHTTIAKDAAKSLLCSRSSDEKYRWELRNLNILTGQLVSNVITDTLALGEVFSKNRTNSYMDTILACNYMNYLFKGCILSQQELQDNIFAVAFGGKTTSGRSGTSSKVLDAIAEFVSGSSPATSLQVLACLRKVTAQSTPQLTLLQAMLEKDPCEESCLSDEACIDPFLQQFVKGFPDEKAAIDYVYTNPEDVMGLVVFEGGDDDGDVIENYKYTLRVNGTDLAPVEKLFLNWEAVGNDNAFNLWKGYYSFVNIQHSIDHAVGSWVSGNLNGSNATNATNESINDSRVLLSPYPTNPFSSQSLEDVASFGMGILFVIGFLGTVIMQLYIIVFEKQMHLQDYQFIMGLKPWIYWAAHFLVSYFVQIIVAVGVSIAAGNAWKYGALMHGDWTTMLLFFLIWQASLTSFVAFMSVSFDRVTMACISGTLMYMLTCLPGVLVTFLYPGGNVAWLIAALLPASNVWIYSSLVMQMENVRSGVRWDNLGMSLLNYPSITAQNLMIIAAGDFFLYLLLMWVCTDKRYQRFYHKLQNTKIRFQARKDILPSPTDSERSVASSQSDSSLASLTLSAAPGEKSCMYQSPEKGKEATVVIEDLKKIYYNKTVALNGLNLYMYENEVTVLLGSNGAGKSTTISILTGRLRASSGDATILGKSILKDMSLIRTAMGVCPQYDSLWPSMTVKEHLIYFSLIKGIPPNETLGEIHTTLSLLKILHQTNTLSKNLSGGQRRKLSLAISILGNPYLILLDEPSTGMDPQSRRDTYSFIKEAKQNRVIMLTTHYMDEAEELGDKIAIMSNGRLKCWGTSSYLKTVLDIGYTLRFLWKGEFDSKRIDSVRKIVERHVSGSKRQTEAGSEMKLIIPETERKNFPSLLRDIQSSAKALDIEFGLSCTTMEDIFLHVINATKPKEGLKHEDTNRLMKTLTERYRHMSKSWQNQFLVLLWKRLMNLKRDLKGFFTQSASSLLLILIGVLTLLFITKRDIPEKQSPVTVKGSSMLDSPDKKIPVAQDFSNGQLTYENLSRLYDSPTSFNATNMTLDDFQTNLASNISNQRISCNRGPDQTCSALYFGTGDNVTAPDDPVYTVLFSQSALHSPAASLDLFDTYKLREKVGENFSLEVVNHPLPQVGVPVYGNLQTYIQVGNLSFTCIVLGIALLGSSFCIYATYEKRLNANMLQILSGTRKLTYHLSNYVWELAYFLLIYACIMAILFVMPTRMLYTYSPDAIAATTLLFLLFGPASIGFAFLLQRPFKSDMISYATLLGVNALLGLIMFDMVSILIAFSFPDFKEGSVPMIVLQVAEWIFPLHPVFALARGFFEITWASFYAKYPLSCKNVFHCSLYTPNKEGNSIVSRYLIFLAVEAVVYMGLFLALELELFSVFPLKSLAWTAEDFEVKKSLEEDSIVREERARVMMISESPAIDQSSRLPDKGGSKDLVVVKNLWVVYGKKVAVKGLSFGLKEGKCFGLLGINGAGKSSFFKILTGAVKAKHGEVLVFTEGKTIDLLNHNLEEKAKLVGYCPQSDALLPRLTVLEQLQLYGAIKGLSHMDIPSSITALVRALGLSKYLNKQTGSLSGGNQRKVSVALALLGDPILVLLDEPSAGLDPKARRSLWNAITNSTEGKTVVLTSHSMEECEALCDNIGLMAGGEFHAFGTIDGLKERFGQGYTLLLYAKEGKLANVLSFLQPNVWMDVDEVCGNEVRVRLSADCDLAWVFEQIEDKQDDILDYSVSPTTLEEIFLGFAGGLMHNKGLCHTSITIKEEIPAQLSTSLNRSRSAQFTRRGSRSFKGLVFSPTEKFFHSIKSYPGRNTMYRDQL